jgi:ADP-heptose:LPS heptosyltransferase
VLLAGPWVQLLAEQGSATCSCRTRGHGAGGSAPPTRCGPSRRHGGALADLSFEAAASAIYWAAGAIRIPRRPRRWLLTDAPPLPEPRLHQVDEYLRLVGVLDAVATAREPRLTPPEPYADARQRVRDLLLRSGAPEGKPMVGVHLGAAYGPAKVWVRERVVEFCRLGPSLGVVPVLLGAPSDEAEAAAVRGQRRQ